MKIKFSHKKSYQDIKLSYIKMDMIDYEMNICMQKIFMPEPYVTSKWVIIILIFTGVSICGLCILKALSKGVSQAKKEEFKAWKEELEEIKQKELDKIRRARERRRARRSKNGSSKVGGSRRGSNASLLSQYSKAPDGLDSENLKTPSESNSTQRGKLPPINKSRFAQLFQKVRGENAAEEPFLAEGEKSKE
jgi:hypothetical protein